MKHKFIITALITSILLTGCNSGNNKEPETTTPIPEPPQPIIEETEPAIVTKPVSLPEKPEVTTTREEKKTPYSSEPNDKNAPINTTDKNSPISGNPEDYVKGIKVPDNIYGPDLTKIVKADITDIKESSIDSKRLWQVKCGGFAYLALPSGLCFNNADDPEFNEKEGTAYLKFERYNVGDKIMDFTVKEAETYFSTLNEIGSEKTRFYNGGTVTLEGKVTMEGYIRISPDDEVGYYENDIIFIPSHDSELLPILDIPTTVSLTGMSEKYLQAYDINGFKYIDEYPVIILGSAKSDDFELSGVEKGEIVKALVTVDGVIMKATGSAGTYILADKADIKL